LFHPGTKNVTDEFSQLCYLQKGNKTDVTNASNIEKFGTSSSSGINPGAVNKDAGILIIILLPL
jgi:hypothetical protein